MTRATLLLTTLCLSVGCRPDEDGDGVLAGEDCDDQNPKAWNGARDLVRGSLSENYRAFCGNRCARDLKRDLDLSRANQRDVASLYCLSSVGGSVYINDNPALEGLAGSLPDGPLKAAVALWLKRSGR